MYWTYVGSFIALISVKDYLLLKENHTKAGPSSMAGTVLAVPVFTSLNEETRKKT